MRLGIFEADFSEAAHHVLRDAELAGKGALYLLSRAPLGVWSYFVRAGREFEQNLGPSSPRRRASAIETTVVSAFISSRAQSGAGAGAGAGSTAPVRVTRRRRNRERSTAASRRARATPAGQRSEISSLRRRRPADLEPACDSAGGGCASAAACRARLTPSSDADRVGVARRAATAPRRRESASRRAPFPSGGRRTGSRAPRRSNCGSSSLPWPRRSAPP